MCRTDEFSETPEASRPWALETPFLTELRTRLPPVTKKLPLLSLSLSFPLALQTPLRTPILMASLLFKRSPKPSPPPLSLSLLVPLTLLDPPMTPLLQHLFPTAPPVILRTRSRLLLFPLALLTPPSQALAYSPSLLSPSIFGIMVLRKAAILNRLPLALSRLLLGTGLLKPLITLPRTTLGTRMGVLMVMQPMVVLGPLTRAPTLPLNQPPTELQKTLKAQRTLPQRPRHRLMVKPQATPQTTPQTT